MSWTRSTTVAAVAAAALSLAWPSLATASGSWGWPVDGSVAAAYGSRYVSEQGVECTHGGVDIAASAGAIVRACAAGEVVFSGLVPAGEGERSWAVTILTREGLRVTYLPLRDSSLAKGEPVDVGARIGALAGDGDASSTVSHLHLGVRRGETRLDPLSFLGERRAVSAAAKVAASAPKASSPPRARAGSKPAPSTAPAPARAPARAPVQKLQPRLPSAALSRLPVQRSMSLVADPPRLKTAQIARDVTSFRDLLAGLLVRLGIAGVAGACAWPVLRAVLDGRAQVAPAAMAAEHEEA